MLEKLRELNVIQKLALVAAFFTTFSKPFLYHIIITDTDEQFDVVWLALIASFILIAVLFGDKRAD